MTIALIAVLLQAAPVAATPALPPAPAPPWVPMVHNDAAAGTASTSVYVLSQPPGARLSLRCDARTEKIVSFQFRASGGLGAGPMRPLSITFDGGTPLIANWEFISDIALERDDAAVTTIAAALANAKQIKIHTTSITGEPVDAVFTGPPSAAPVNQVLNACGYTLGQVPVRAPAKPPAK